MVSNGNSTLYPVSTTIGGRSGRYDRNQAQRKNYYSRIYSDSGRAVMESAESKDCVDRELYLSVTAFQDNVYLNIVASSQPFENSVGANAKFVSIALASVFAFVSFMLF